MTRIDPAVLKRLRLAKGWSQGELSERTQAIGPKIDKQTICRLENGRQQKTRDRIIRQLARALSTEPAVLTGERALPEVEDDQSYWLTSKLNFRISTSTHNAFHLVGERYYVTHQEIVELAPFLFCCVAEASLNERRERLQQVKLACDAAKNAQGRMRHLPKPDLSPSEEQIAAEQDSIDREDIFGMFLDELGPRGQSYNDARDNPFALFLDKLADATNGVATFEAYAGRDFPDYRVCIQEAEHFADGDSELAEEILRGHVALQDMPKELRKNGSWKDQAAWVRSKAEQFRKEMIRRIEERRKEEGSP